MKFSKMLQCVLLSAMLVIPNLSHGRDNHFLGFYDKYEGRNDFTSFSLSPDFLNSFISKDEKELRQFLKTIDHVKMLVYEGKPDSVKYFSNELKSTFQLGWYDDLLVVKDGKDNVNFKVRMNDKKINELIMVVSNQGSLVVFYMDGEIELSKVKQLSKSISIQGFNHLDKLPADRN